MGLSGTGEMRLSGTGDGRPGGRGAGPGYGGLLGPATAGHAEPATAGHSEPPTARRPGRRHGARLLTRFFAVLLMVAGGIAAGPAAPATAAALPSACSGSPDRVYPFATGELRIYKNHRYACAVTHAKRPGPRRTMSVSLQPRGGRAVMERGRFTRRAGPVSVHALHRCVRATGKVSGTGRSTGWILC
ncbi:hypothetical protein [Streptomyces katsurahamanus]|nr:hypothetical protein [Streptomyces katsurahamanus]